MASGARIHEVLPEGLKAELMPKHVAVILDGNRRWAKQQGLPTGLGHIKALSLTLDHAFLSNKLGIKVMSIFCFSTENWKRSQGEVDHLMELFKRTIITRGEDFMRRNMRVSVLGDKSKLPQSLIDLMNSIEEKTKYNNGLHVMFATNYSGQYDITQATRNIAMKVKDEILKIEDIDGSLIEKELQTSCAEYPNPDLLIRTSGELRISNFMLWQMANTELFFSKKMFPEFEEQDYIEALISFQNRNKRFGGKEH